MDHSSVSSSVTPSERRPLSYGLTPEQLAELANRILQADVPGVS